MAMAASTEASRFVGEWRATKDVCAFGYTAVWSIAEEHGGLVARENCGAHCCGCVPNPFPKTLRLTRQGGATEWQGTQGCHTIGLAPSEPDDGTLRLVTKDGWFRLARVT